MIGTERLISFAAVSGPQGLDGEVKVLSLSDHQRRFMELPGKEVLWRRGVNMRVLKVTEVRGDGRYYFLRFVQVTDRVKAQELTQGELVVPESELIPLPAGSYYLHEIIGLRVSDMTLGELGLVTEVLQPGSNDVYVVEGPLGQVLIPALKSVVLTIDLAKGHMEVDLPEGLLQDDED
jgi:16S rRNA processing protein RimM